MSQAELLSTLAPGDTISINSDTKITCTETCVKPYFWNWNWISTLLLWIIVFTVLFWLIYYSLKLPFVLQTDSNQVDTAKVLFAAFISAIILVVIIWLIKLGLNYNR